MPRTPLGGHPLAHRLRRPSHQRTPTPPSRAICEYLLNYSVLDLRMAPTNDPAVRDRLRGETPGEAAARVGKRALAAYLTPLALAAEAEAAAAAAAEEERRARQEEEA